MMEIHLPKKIIRLWLPLGLAISLLLVLGGIYFWHRGLAILSRPAPSEVEGMVSGTQSPPDLPADVPFYEGAVLLSTSKTESGVQLTFETIDSLSRVYSFYERSLLSFGWRKTRERQNDNGVYLLYTRRSQVLELNLVYDLQTQKTVAMLYVNL